MSMKAIVKLPPDNLKDSDSTLRRPAEAVVLFDEELRSDLAALVATFEDHRIAVGLAGPQIGIPRRIAVINITKEKAAPHLILVNPEVLEVSRRTESRYESCMSIPHYKGKVARAAKIQVSFLDQFGVKQSLRAEGFLARVICHEVDHLNGLLYVDQMSNDDRLEKTDIFKND